MEGNLFRRFYLDKEKDMIVELYHSGEDRLSYVLRTPSHRTGNLITNLAALCRLPLSEGEDGLKVIRGTVPCYIDGYNRPVYIFRLGNTKVANIYPDGTVEMKASIPAIAKTLMSQTKDYRLGIEKTIVKTYIRRECKFRTDLHTHMNANLKPDILIALGICHQIRYPLYYIKKLDLSCTPGQWQFLEKQREITARQFAGSSTLTGKYLTRRIDDMTFINFADLILNAPEYAEKNISKIRRSLAILKDGQAVFTNLEKVYLYRYVFTKGLSCDGFSENELSVRTAKIPDEDIRRICLQILEDRHDPAYRNNTLFQDKLLWIARSYRDQGISYAEISDTTLVKTDQAAKMLAQVHAVMPAILRETGVLLRFLAAIRRIPLTIVKDKITLGDYFSENIRVLEAVADDPYVAGSDIIGEEINDIRDIQPVIREIVRIAKEHPYFVIRIHAGENDSLRDNVANSIRCVRDALAPGQAMPRVRIGHGLYTADLNRPKGRELIRALQESGAVLEFQITSNVRLNNLSTMGRHPLRQYLKYNIRCVQGTDGGALYGTDSIDEQLALEKLLELTPEELLKMRRSEDFILEESLQNFRRKQEAFFPGTGETTASASAAQIEQYYTEKIQESAGRSSSALIGERRLVASDVLKDCICEMPADMLPVVIAGGSFNNDRRRTRLHVDDRALIDMLLEKGDPSRLFFVIGHRLTGYEQYLLAQNRGRFRVFAIVPAMISAKEEKKLRKSGAGIRVSIEPAPMGLYKSFAYELFKRRFCVLAAFDGNSACANMIQEAKNSRYKCRIYVSRHSRNLTAKAGSLEGYMTLFEKENIGNIASEILRYSVRPVPTAPSK